MRKMPIAVVYGLDISRLFLFVTMVTAFLNSPLLYLDLQKRKSKITLRR